MLIYGYTKINSEGGTNGKESYTVLFPAKKQRNESMYEDYAETFDTMATECGFEKTEAGFVDDAKIPKLTKEQFAIEMENSKDPEADVFGVIQAYDHHVQYEPFVKAVNK